jgi:transcription elongation factor Elf1
MLTETQIKKYVENATDCPFCGSNNLKSPDFPEEGDAGLTELKTTVVCGDCNKKWLEQFKLYNIVELDG